MNTLIERNFTLDRPPLERDVTPEEIQFDPKNIKSIEDVEPDRRNDRLLFCEQVVKFTGAELFGHYIDNKTDMHYPLVCFHYCKTAADGSMETRRRVVIMTGLWRGVHPNHRGQSEAFYLKGFQVGTLGEDPADAQMINNGRILDGKNDPKKFSVDCIFGGPRENNPLEASSGVSFDQLNTP